MVSAAGNGKIEQGLCDAGAIQGLLGLIRRCQEEPGEAPKPARKSSRKPRPPPLVLRDLLEPAIVALSNLAAETASVKDDMRQAGAIEACVQLLTAKVGSAGALPDDCDHQRAVLYLFC